uniref:Viral expression factor 1 n=1 Tax=Lymantria dispar multicapsid nuclear polyhedrosis virus TaxID=10449 RepID=A0A1B1MQU5_NPVLD|nr:viral expression factor 1 [Lymantria dispar multiple nucleopolyhedrovirus]
MNSVTVTLNVLPVELPAYLDVSETALALHHSRVPLGYVCNETTIITVRSTAACELWFLNNNRNQELSFVINSDESSTLTHNRVYVPFVNRIVGGDAGGFTIVCTIENYLTVLPHYTHNNTNETSFKNEVRASDETTCYAFLELEHALLLVPPADRDELLALNLMSINNFYTTIVNTFDNLIGLINNASSSSFDNNFNKKFFCKADVNGAGVAYYGRNWTAQTSSSMTRYLQPRTTNWMVFHEIAHAYDFQFVGNTPSLGEVWNNILADRYQYDFMTYEERQREASVYENGNRERVELDITNLISNGTVYNYWSFYQKLIVFTWMMDTPQGRRVMNRINRQFRQIKVTEPNPRYMTIFDWWVLLSDVDFVPFLKLMQIPLVSCRILPNNHVVDSFLYADSLVRSKRIYYPVRELVRNFDVITNSYGLVVDSNYSLILPTEINVRTSFIIQCVIDDRQQITAQTFHIYDGTHLMLQLQINESNQLVVNNLPVGVYTIVAPRGRNRRYKLYFDAPHSIAGLHEHLYLIANDTGEPKRLIYEPMTSSPAGDCIMGHVLGINNMYRAKVIINFKLQTLYVHSYNQVYNQGYGTGRYFQINISEDSEIFFNHTFGGTQNVVGTLSSNFRKNNTVYTYHPQGNIRMNFMNVLVGLNNTILLSEIWHDNINLPTRIEAITTRINECVAYLYANASRLIPFENPIKDELYMSIQSLPDKDYYMKLYEPFLPIYFKSNLFPDAPASINVAIMLIVAGFILVILLVVFFFFLMRRSASKPQTDV